MEEPTVAQAIIKLGDAIFYGLIFAALIRGMLNK